MTNSIRVDFKGVSVNYGDYTALNGMDLECRDGEFISIVGTSGSGKSSILNVVAGLIPYQGDVCVTGSLGYVFQSFALFPWFTVAGNIGFGLEKWDRAKKAARVDEMLEKIELTGNGLRYPNQLSGGQIQRVALARALAPNPQILLMDEPYASLDHHTRERMAGWLLSLWEAERKTVLFVTHYVDEAIFLSDRILVLRDNKFACNLKIPFTRPRSEDLRFSERFLDVKKAVLDYMEG
jgi:NitT/TauT family transport system ATP-binding protein